MIRIGNIQFKKLPLLLAPMEDVTNPPFRYLCKQQGVDLMYTEFISSEGLIRDAEKSIKKLTLYDYERPIGIQIFGNDIESMRQAALIAEEAKPDLLDINYGCPVKNVACKGAGAGILLDLPKMQKMTETIVKVLHIPVTVKTRLGWDEKTINILEAAQRLQDIGIQALTIHARTRKQLYKGSADWSYIDQVKNHPSIHIPIFGNGDVKTPQQVQTYQAQYKVNGVMIGRAAIGYPWIFREVKHFLETGEELNSPTLAERIEAIKIHLDYSIKWKGERTGVLEMRKHYTNYLRGYAKEYRKQLVEAKTHAEVLDILNKSKIE